MQVRVHVQVVGAGGCTVHTFPLDVSRTPQIPRRSTASADRDSVALAAAGRDRDWCVGALWAGVFGAVLVAGILFATVVRSAAPAPVDWILARSGARPIRAIDSPFLFEVMRELSRRAGINAPQLYLLPQREPNAMAIGTREHGAVAVTPAILRMMNRRELAGVLAHRDQPSAKRRLARAGPGRTRRRG